MPAHGAGKMTNRSIHSSPQGNEARSSAILTAVVVRRYLLVFPIYWLLAISIPSKRQAEDLRFSTGVVWDPKSIQFKQLCGAVQGWRCKTVRQTVWSSACLFVSTSSSAMIIRRHHRRLLTGAIFRTGGENPRSGDHLATYDAPRAIVFPVFLFYVCSAGLILTSGSFNLYTAFSFALCDLDDCAAISRISARTQKRVP